MKKILLIGSFLLSSVCALAQTGLDIPLSVISEKPLITILDETEVKHKIRFFYLREWLEPFVVSERHHGKKLGDVLGEILKDSGIGYVWMFDYALIFSKDPSHILNYQSLLRTAVQEKRDIEKIRIGSKRISLPGQRVIFSGSIKSEFSGTTLGEVLITVDNNLRFVSDAEGRFSIQISPGFHIVNFQLSNFKQKVIDLEIYENGSASVILEENPTVLEEIEITDQAIVTRRMGQSNLRMTDVKRAPTFLGEVDVIKQIQHQPGVTTVGEVASGFNVRGGGVDQNLVLYDGVPILNTSHALGFFTAFNSDAIKNVAFYRGGIPAEYGGRVSSVLDITSKEGNPHKIEGGGGIGIISSYITIGGPIKKDTTTFNASVRTSYSDWMLNAVKSNYRDTRKSSVSFYDGSFKLAHAISKRSKLTMSGYTSYDDFSLTNDTVYSTRNIAGALRLDHTFNADLFASASLTFGRYNYKVTEKDPANAFDMAYNITYPSLKLDFNYEGLHKVSFGLHHTFYVFNPGSLHPRSSESTAAQIVIPNEQALESALYLSDAFYWREKFLIEAGARFSLYNRIGPGTVFHYGEGARERRNLIDSVTYSNGEIMKTFGGIEPRLSLQYTLNENASVKVGYNRMLQYLHLVTNTAAVTPLDIWQASNTYFKPQIADQLSVGYYKSLNKNMFETFAEVFYKSIQNTLDFKDGAQLILNRNIETALVNGTTKSYGIEFSVSKIKGRLLGAVNYTFSRSLRKTNGILPSENINNGSFYSSNYDQPHVANVNWRYGISRRIFFSGNFTYHTGRPMSLPVSGYNVDGVPVQNFTERNKYRIPDYHRADVALIVEGNHRLKKFWDGTWVFSFYNVYARRNAYSVFFQDDGQGILVPYKLSVIGTVIPSVSYSFKF